eukprot:TRINITY_DN47568_c0_g1_i1.p1 TRINITY_DN47568_c0_g1~~TRINITY_DN47568_c0_g1_i1.p1  ORF type:complete len:480 (+),score=71.65 TRINITY_DN47568_c0_g1_i1:49-1488(+)
MVPKLKAVPVLVLTLVGVALVSVLAYRRPKSGYRCPQCPTCPTVPPSTPAPVEATLPPRTPPPATPVPRPVPVPAAPTPVEQPTVERSGERPLRDPKFNPPADLVERMVSGRHKRFSNDVSAEYLRHLQRAMIREPAHALRNSTAPRVAVSCTGPEWSGRRSTPVRIVDLFPFAYETDLLEVRLLEHDGLVDQVVLYESTYTHRMARKQLTFPLVAERYARWREKILYVVSDDAEMYEHYRPTTQSSGESWTNDNAGHVFPWKRYLKSLKGGSLPGNTLYIHGDCDGIPSRRQVAHFKYCVPSRPLPAIFELSLHQHNFRVQKRAGGGRVWHAGIFEASDVVRNHNSMPWKLHHKGARKYSPDMGWDITRGMGPYADAFKELSISEGGGLVMDSVIRDPSVAARWHQCGMRTCCAIGDSTDLTLWRGEVPWAVAANPDRYPFLLPPPRVVDGCPAYWAHTKRLGPKARELSFPRPGRGG